MTQPVSGNAALVPRRPQKPQDNDWEEVRVEDDPMFTGYAPPGAQWQARVRRLGGEEAAAPVGTVDDGLQQKAKHNGVTVERNGNEGVTLKIQAEVTVLGALPPEGIAIETVTVVKGSSGEGA